jgi:choline dehydrogenase
VHDVLIVGGGSAGCVLAARLSEDPGRRVLLVEAGSDHPDFAQAPAPVRVAVGGVAVTEGFGRLDWGYTGRGSALGGVIAIPRGRVMGGSGAVNGCIFLRGLPEDFERWARLVGPGWGWEHMLPAYRAIEADPVGDEAAHGREGPFPVFRYPRVEWSVTQAAFEAACLDLGYGATPDHNAADAMGVSALPLNQEDGLRWGPARALLDAAVRARPNLTLRADTRALGLAIRDGRVHGVHARDAAGTSLLQAGETILAAGAVGSPHLLLLSGIGPAADLRRLGIKVVADVPGVGSGVRDHPKAWIEWRLRDGVPGSLADPVLQLSTRYTASGSDLRGDMMLYPNSIVPGPQEGTLGFRIEAVNNLQLSAGRLALRSADPDVPPDIDLRLLAEERDRDRLVDAIERSLALAETPALRAVCEDLVRPDVADPTDRRALADYVERTVMTGQHISSSCPMGHDDDPMAVVGGDGRVRGIGGLRIVDGSIMPDSVRANTHATILAMAELMAGRIRAEG